MLHPLRSSHQCRDTGRLPDLAPLPSPAAELGWPSGHTGLPSEPFSRSLSHSIPSIFRSSSPSLPLSPIDGTAAAPRRPHVRARACTSRALSGVCENSVTCPGELLLSFYWALRQLWNWLEWRFWDDHFQATFCFRRRNLDGQHTLWECFVNCFVRDLFYLLLWNVVFFSRKSRCAAAVYELVMN